MKKNGDNYMDSRRACADKWDRLLNWSEIQSDAQQTNAAKNIFNAIRNDLAFITLEMFRSIGALLALRNLHLQALLLFPLARQLNSAMQAIGEEAKIRLEI